MRCPSKIASEKAKNKSKEIDIYIFEKGLDLLYGNIPPFEQCTRGDKRLKEHLKLVARNREELDGSLTEKQEETQEKFEDCMNEMRSITERDTFLTASGS